MAEEKRIGNWGKWGPNDEVGTLNYVTPEVIKRAAGLVKRGKVYSLAIPLSKDAPIWPSRNKIFHFVSARNNPMPGGGGGAEDIITMHSHGTTHIDSLAHVWFDSKLYNGWPASVVTGFGAQRNSIDKIKGIVSRGILLDVAGLKAVGALDAGYSITPKDLQDCLTWEGLNIQSGDVVLIRTGFINILSQQNTDPYCGEPGIGLEAALWLNEKEVSAIGADNGAVECISPRKPPTSMPVHPEMIRNRGCHLMELLQLDELAADKAYQFLFVVAPLKLKNGLGSPINPLAIA